MERESSPPENSPNETSHTTLPEDTDGGVAEVQGEDATMEDAGRPPEPEGGQQQTWADRVTGRSVARRLIPEQAIDEEFVAARMKQSLPEGEEGDLVYSVDKEVLNAMDGLWRHCLILKVLGRRVPLIPLEKKLKQLWIPSGTMSIVDLPRHFFMIRFEHEVDYLRALTGGPWTIYGNYLLIQGWSPDFSAYTDDIVTTPVCIRIHDLPLNFYHKTILTGLAAGLGKPIRIDPTTSNIERARFARICVEVNLQKRLRSSIIVNGVRYTISYERLGHICSKCEFFGHVAPECPRNKQTPPDSTEAEVEATRNSEDKSKTQEPSPEATEEGFTTVKTNRPRRGLTAIKDRKKEGTTHQTRTQSDNRFASLGEEEHARQGCQIGQTEKEKKIVGEEDEHARPGCQKGQMVEKGQKIVGEGVGVDPHVGKEMVVFSRDLNKPNVPLTKKDGSNILNKPIFGPVEPTTQGSLRFMASGTKAGKGKQKLGPLRTGFISSDLNSGLQDLDGLGKRVRVERQAVGRARGNFTQEALLATFGDERMRIEGPGTGASDPTQEIIADPPETTSVQEIDMDTNTVVTGEANPHPRGEDTPVTA